MRDFSPTFVNFYYQNLFFFFLKEEDIIINYPFKLELYPVILKELTFIGNAGRRPKFTIDEA